VTCPLCGKNIKDRLQHFAIVHEIFDVEQFTVAIQKIDNGKHEIEEYRSLVAKLKEQKAKGLISAEEYRALVMKKAKET